MHLAEPLIISAGQEQGILIHSAANRVCYSRKQQGAEDSVLRLKPWYATSSMIPFANYQPPGNLYIHAGSIHYTTHVDDARKRSVSVPAAKTSGTPTSASRLRAPPRHGAEEKHAWKCEICNLFFTSSQALGGHRSTSQEHRESLASLESKDTEHKHAKDVDKKETPPVFSVPVSARESEKEKDKIKEKAKDRDKIKQKGKEKEKEKDKAKKPDANKSDTKLEKRTVKVEHSVSLVAVASSSTSSSTLREAESCPKSAKRGGIDNDVCPHLDASVIKAGDLDSKGPVRKKARIAADPAATAFLLTPQTQEQNKQNSKAKVYIDLGVKSALNLVPWPGHFQAVGSSSFAPALGMPGNLSAAYLLSAQQAHLAQQQSMYAPTLQLIHASTRATDSSSMASSSMPSNSMASGRMMGATTAAPALFKEKAVWQSRVARNLAAETPHFSKSPPGNAHRSANLSAQACGLIPEQALLLGLASSMYTTPTMSGYSISTGAPMLREGAVSMGVSQNIEPAVSSRAGQRAGGSKRSAQSSKTTRELNDCKDDAGSRSKSCGAKGRPRVLASLASKRGRGHAKTSLQEELDEGLGQERIAECVHCHCDFSHVNIQHRAAALSFHMSNCPGLPLLALQATPRRFGAEHGKEHVGKEDGKAQHASDQSGAVSDASGVVSDASGVAEF